MSVAQLDPGVEYLDLIAEAIAYHPRSLQTRIGPSEIGHPCPRRIGYKLLGTPERPGPPNWKATVGTALHAWLEDVFDRWNVANCADGVERFYVETRVEVGEVNGEPVTGSCDLYDAHTFTVTDWKTTGPTTLKKYARHGPGDQYRTQAHLYGRGFTRQGMRVDRVQIVFLPRNGELGQAVVWSEPYDEAIALTGLTRLAGIALATQYLGTAALAQLDTRDAWCHLCPYYRAQSTDPTLGCPGDPASNAGKPLPSSADPFDFGGSP